MIDFTLNKTDPSQPDPKLTLTPDSPTPGVSLLQLSALPPATSTSSASTAVAVTSTPAAAPIGRGANPDQPVPTVPEPASLALWSALAAAALLRARHYSRHRSA